MFDLKDMLDRLPHVFSEEPESDLGKFLQIITEQFKELDRVKNEVEKTSKINEAEEYNLDRLGNNVQQGRANLDDEKYRALIKTKISSNLSAGDVNSIIEYLAAILQLDREEVTVRQNIYEDFRFSGSDEVENSERHGFSSLIFSFNKTSQIDKNRTLNRTKTFDRRDHRINFFEYLFSLQANYRNREDGGEFFDPASINIQIPLEDTAFDQEEIIDLVNRLTAAGVRTHYIEE